jgi:hypothetical protein
LRAGGGTTRLAVAVVLAAGLGGCATARIEDGVFHSARGYRVALPGPEWRVATDGRAELDLRHRAVAAGMLANAVCDRTAARQSAGVLARHVLVGLRDRAVLERATVSLGGRPALRTVVEGRPESGGDRVRVEAWVLTDGRCVFDLLYVARVDVFETGWADFRRLVASFGTE